MDSFENRDPNYVILENSKKIYFNSQEVEWADPDSFELLPDPEYNRAGFAKDKNNVYYNWKKLEWVDPDSFDAMFGAKVPIMRDKNYVYYKLGGANFVKIEWSSPQKLKFIDRPSWWEWNLSYYEDERYKYYDNTMVVDHIDGKEDEVTEIYDKKNKTYYPL
jgi:hypothetical protein